MPPTEHAQCHALSQSKWFSEHVQPHEPALRAYLSRRFPTGCDHDDLVQETYSRLLRLENPRGLTHPKAFLFTTARNAATVLDDRGNFVRFPGGKEKSEGQELELFYTPFRDFQLTGGITRLNATYTGVTRGQEHLLGKRLATTAEWQGSAFGRYNFSEGGLKGFSLGGGGYYLGPGAQGDLPRTPPKSYIIFDAVFAYEHKLAGLDVRYAPNATNVFDKDHYRDFTNPYPPRTITLSTRVRF